LHPGVRRVGGVRKDGRIGRLGRSRNGIDGGGIVTVRQAVEALFRFALVIPPQAEVQRQPIGGAPVILRIKAGEVLRVDSGGIAGQVSAGGQTEQE
jgi:hypothetical protein